MIFRRPISVVESLNTLEQQGTTIDKDVYSELLRRCASSRDLEQGRRIHTQLLSTRFHQDRYLGNLLVEMYGKCGCVEEAHKAFLAIRRKNIFSWNIMIGAYAQNGHSREALDLFKKMDTEGISASNVTFVSLLSACSDLGDATEGSELHTKIISCEFDSQTIIANALINMYGRCRSVQSAKEVFKRTAVKTVITWNSMISAYAQNGHTQDALKLYREMDPEGFKPNRVTFLNALDAVSMQGAVAKPLGRRIHSRIIETGLTFDVPLTNSLVNMYAKCGSLVDAEKVFEKLCHRDVVSWTAMITAYAQNGYGSRSLKLYREMDLEGVPPDEVTLVSVLDACAQVTALSEGREVHEMAVSRGYDGHVVLATALVNMYVECGELQDAERVFQLMTRRTIFTWNTMIGAYTRNGHPEKALELYRDLEEDPNEVTLAAVLEACPDLSVGREIHARAVSMNMHTSNVVGSALVDLYGRCGSVKEAGLVFNSMFGRDLVSWTAMITAYSHHGWGDEALELFMNMNLDGVFPNCITFISVLSSCSYSGVLNTAREHFVSMSVDYGIEPTSDHYECVVDVLGRAGKLEVAQELLQCMPYEPGVVVWMSFLSASKLNGEFSRGEVAAQRLVELDPANCSTYLVVSNMYASIKR